MFWGGMVRSINSNWGYVKSKAELVSEWQDEVPADTILTTTPSGWMESSQFYEWFRHFERVPLGLVGHIVLFLGGHKSHLSVECSDLARRHTLGATRTAYVSPFTTIRRRRFWVCKNVIEKNCYFFLHNDWL